MRAEVVAMGAQELKSAADVQTAMAERSGTALFFVNSVCGCAAGSARPGLGVSLSASVRPDRIYTVFAGQDSEAVAEVRRHLVGYPPSSPCIALFKDGDLVAMIERHQIQGQSAEQLGTLLSRLYAEHCAAASA